MQTLSNFFNIQGTSLNWASSMTQTPAFKQAQHVMAQQVVGVPLPKRFYEYLVTRLHKALDIDLGHILAWGWCKQREIASYRDKQSPSGKPYEVKLVKSTVKSKHSPTIKPIIYGIPYQELQFDIVLKLTTDSCILIIKNGKIIKIRTGSCVGSGSIEYAGYTLIEKKTAPFNLPGSIRFKNGIQI